MPDFNSENWFPAIEELAKEYFEYSNKKFVHFKADELQSLRLRYKERSRAVKDDVFEDPAASRIDRHKIIALYIQLLLEKPLFVHHDLNAGPIPTPWTILMNEYFCLDFTITVLESWTGKTIDRTRLKEYKCSFLKLLDRYRREHCKLKKNNLYFTYTFAHLIYFLERDFSMVF
jgi:hypothetical protein